MNKSRRVLSILLTLVILAALLAPMAVPAAASSTYTVNSIQSVSASTWYNDGVGTFNRIIVEVAPGSLTVGQQAYVRMSLPVDFLARAALDIPNFSTGTNLVAGTTQIYPVGTPTDSPAAGTLNTYREWDVMIVGGNTTDKGLLYIDLDAFKVPSGKSGDIKVSFDAAPGTPLSSGQVVIAQIGTGIVTVSMDEVKTINTAGGAIGDVLIKEDRAGALVYGTKAVKLKLPNGFTWAAPTGTPAQLVYGDATILPAAATFTREDSDRTLVIPQGRAAGGGSNAATYYRLTGLNIRVDESVAKNGNIEATISGDSTISTSTLIVGKLGDFDNTVSAFGDPLEVRAGRRDEEIGKFAIEESAAGSLVNGRTITLQLTGGAVWKTSPRVDAANSKNNNALTWALVSPITSSYGDYSDTIKATVTGTIGNNPAKYVLEKGTIDVSGAAKPEIKIIVGGTAGAAGEVVVAKTIKQITMKVDKVASVIAGKAEQPISDIVITEAKAECIAQGDFNAATPGLTGLYIQFPAGTFPSLPNVEVIEGDLVINKDSIARGVTPDGRWAVGVSIKSTSTKPSKLKFSNLKLNVDRDFAEGAIIAGVTGALSPATIRFPGITGVGYATVANVVTPASREVRTNASFVIGSNKYKSGGVEKTMDIAPYVKDGRTFLPVRYVAEALGVSNDNIMWNEADQAITLLKGDMVVQLKIGSDSLLVNGVTVRMDVAAEIASGRTMLPVRFIAQSLGATVSWDEATKTVTLK